MIDLHTTNVLLGIMAVASVLEALVLVGVAVCGFLEYRRLTRLVSDLQTRQLAPMREKLDAILADVQAVTARVSQQTERVDHAITGTMDRVDVTAERVKSTVREKVAAAVGVVRGVRAIIMSVLHHETEREPPAAAAGRA
jgi:hypothetical protein